MLVALGFEPRTEGWKEWSPATTKQAVQNTVQTFPEPVYFENILPALAMEPGFGFCQQCQEFPSSLASKYHPGPMLLNLRVQMVELVFPTWPGPTCKWNGSEIPNNAAFARKKNNKKFLATYEMKRKKVSGWKKFDAAKKEQEQKKQQRLKLFRNLFSFEEKATSSRFPRWQCSNGRRIIKLTMAANTWNPRKDIMKGGLDCVEQFFKEEVN